MFCEMHLLISTGRIERPPPADPRSLLHAAMLFANYPEEQHFVKPRLETNPAELDETRAGPSRRPRKGELTPRWRRVARRGESGPRVKREVSVEGGEGR